eukprot:CAMPEP_0184984360 /NCGR_PEP_ID=MMETSP1098-20130426/13350_1 /TAXON_ID=89044 /ORGANISM="Spumella elongata, Strain CCAP 955/1" /LENGTH=90 /DNA_ID=CAMNT_0027508321 /DNA_START=82 /DNA_END=354 /DNA_ORIENTATION=-
MSGMPKYQPELSGETAPTVKVFLSRLKKQSMLRVGITSPSKNWTFLYWVKLNGVIFSNAISANPKACSWSNNLGNVKVIIPLERSNSMSS